MFISPNKLSTYVSYFYVRKSTTTFLVYPIKTNGKMGCPNSVGLFNLTQESWLCVQGDDGFQSHIWHLHFSTPCATLKPQGPAQGCTCLMESFWGMCLPHGASLRDSLASQSLPCSFLLTSLGIACLMAFVLFWLHTPHGNDSVFLGEFNCETVIAQAGVGERFW